MSLLLAQQPLTVSLVRSVMATGAGSPVTTTPIDTTGANAIVIAAVTNTSTNPTFSDNMGNSYIANVNSPGTYRTIIGSTSDTTTFVPSTAHTFTATKAGGLGGYLYAFAIAGAFRFVLDRTGNRAVGAGATSIGLVVGMAVNAVGEFILAVVSADTGFASPTISPAGFTIAYSQDYVSGTQIGGAAAYLINTATGPVNPTWSWTTAVGSNGVACAVQSAAHP